jgi:hypothetical protein
MSKTVCIIASSSKEFSILERVMNKFPKDNNKYVLTSSYSKQQLFVEIRRGLEVIPHADFVALIGSCIGKEDKTTIGDIVVVERAISTTSIHEIKTHIKSQVNMVISNAKKFRLETTRPLNDIKWKSDVFLSLLSEGTFVKDQYMKTCEVTEELFNDIKKSLHFYINDDEDISLTEEGRKYVLRCKTLNPFSPWPIQPPTMSKFRLAPVLTRTEEKLSDVWGRAANFYVDAIAIDDHSNKFMYTMNQNETCLVVNYVNSYTYDIVDNTFTNYCTEMATLLILEMITKYL